ncbi:hypothetical protein ACPPVO_53880 [Dactylosporangium sp. McL0621]|uniref:hypothetical protein n=1 Tax=Dactylosporangium sp. McL0621 TaxID=3415678 RepID=UPI003CF347E9
MAATWIALAALGAASVVQLWMAGLTWQTGVYSPNVDVYAFAAAGVPGLCVLALVPPLLAYRRGVRSPLVWPVGLALPTAVVLLLAV